MKLLQRRIQEAAKNSGVSQLVVERDAQSSVLFGSASHARAFVTPAHVIKIGMIQLYS